MKFRDDIRGFLQQYAVAGRANPAMICRVTDSNVTRISEAYAKGDATYPGVFGNAHNFPTLSALLVHHSDAQVSDYNLPKDSDYNIAVTGYPPHLCDFGMCYRNDIRYLISASGLTPMRVWSCWEVNGNGDHANRQPLAVARMPVYGPNAVPAIEKLLDGTVTSSGSRTVTVDPSTICGFDWFEKFIIDARKSVTLPAYYQEEFTDLNLQPAPEYRWRAHKSSTSQNTELFWTLVTLYAVFCWSTQLPTWRADNVSAKPKDLLTGLNVSAILLDQNLTPRGWAVNTNKVNKTLHAETALTLAWLKHGEAQGKSPPYKNYTILSPWHSCAMCASWQSEVFEDSKVVWFTDDPGLPYTHLETKENGNLEFFLPEVLDMGKLQNTAIGKSKYAGYARAMGKATCYDYNKGFQAELNQRAGKETGAILPDLLASKWYFSQVAEAWDATRFLEQSVLDVLERAGELDRYISNILMLRASVMAFDSP